MRLLIDLQGAQTESRFRGIGRYSLSLAVAMARNPRVHQIWLLLNGRLSDSILPLRDAFADLVPRDRIRLFDAPGPLAQADPANHRRAIAAEQLREYAVAQLRPDAVLVTSLFEGYVDDGVVSVGRFAPGDRTAVILYDLIPHLNPQVYLPTQQQRDYYGRKLTSLRNAALLLAISEFAKREAVEALGLNPHAVVAISTAADPKFSPGPPAEASTLETQFGISRPFVLCAPGGFDARKNLDGLITAYALLPSSLRRSHQLVIASKLTPPDRDALAATATQAGLQDGELVLTGYVPDHELVCLYRSARLFVFPSRHEGFGLPALEAMACGAPVIAAGTTSLPEVIGDSRWLFDPEEPQALAALMTQLLSDQRTLSELQKHGVERARQFSWELCAERAWDALEARFGAAPAAIAVSARRPEGRARLAYVSPLPPERTGIATYSADLLAALVEHYDIDLVTDQDDVELPHPLSMLPVRRVAWFEEHAGEFDRVLYQFGNSPFHSHMFDLLRRYPGTVVLHDFFLSSVLAHDEASATRPNTWTQALYSSHGYAALVARRTEGADTARRRFPCNLDVIEAAEGVIVHSAYARRLGDAWYGDGTTKDWTLIPLVRKPAPLTDREAARRALGVPQDAFVICCFGFVDPTKLSDRLVDAWLGSKLRTDGRSRLVLVGSNHGGDFGVRLQSTIDAAALGDRILVTGWVDDATYKRYLQAADCAVQLRTDSRGETSAAALDCMNYGLPVVVNANGSMADLPSNVVLKLPDEFSMADLTVALERVASDAELRSALGAAGRVEIMTNHDPARCARLYADAIERAAQTTASDQAALIRSLASFGALSGRARSLGPLAQSIADATARRVPMRQLLVDVTSVAREDLRSGIERVVRAQAVELLRRPPAGLRVEPVRLAQEHGRWHYRYAREFASALLELPRPPLEDRPVDVTTGDVFYSPAFAPGEVVAAAVQGLYRCWRERGVAMHWLVHDLLTINRPEFFPAGTGNLQAQWLGAITTDADSLVCVSHAVAQDVRDWLYHQQHPRSSSLRIGVVHHGSDIAASAPTQGTPPGGAATLERMRSAPSFLMVGTIEPRKGHRQTLRAFERLWAKGVDVNLVIVGREGWKQLPAAQRRTVPEIVSALSTHAELGRRLFWLQAISDEYLEHVYAACACLLAPSEGEGFGLPVIEAARHGLPVLARDLLVFREVAPPATAWFSGVEAEPLAEAVARWLEHPRDRLPVAALATARTWADNVRELVAWLRDGDAVPGPQRHSAAPPVNDVLV